jgi:hypothetical protein
VDAAFMRLQRNAVSAYVPGGASRERGMPASHISTTSTAFPGQQMLIVKIGLLPEAMEPGIHCARTHWIRGFMAFQLARRQGGGGR